jgi:arylsulfatase A-like enzyme
MNGMRWILTSLLILQVTVTASAAEPPDVLFIAIDDLNDWVGPLGGHPQTVTPNIDALAARGMTFTNAHAVATSCAPSRAALMTGLRPSTSGLYSQAGDWRALDNIETMPTLPRYFRDSGYLTKGAGKLFHAHTYYDSGLGGQQDVEAWRDYFPSLERQLQNEIKPTVIPVNRHPAGANLGQFLGFDWSPVYAVDSATGDGQMISWVEKQLLDTENPGARFIAAGIYRPHLPWYVPEKYFEPFPLESIQLPPVLANDIEDIPGAAPAWMSVLGAHEWVVESGQWKNAVQGYLASIHFADAMVGRLVAALEESGRLDNTIIVLWSDHGFFLGEKERWRKMNLWERSTHVPLIVIAPGVTTPGSASAEPVSLLDVYPTLTELAGLDTPGHVQGMSLVPLLKDPDTPVERPAITVYGAGNYAVRDRRYRYIRYVDGSEEFYDHDSDPHEWHNLAGDDSIQGEKSRLAAWIAEDPVPERLDSYQAASTISGATPARGD